MLIQTVTCSLIYLIPSAIYLCGFQEEGVDDIEDEDQDEFDPIEHLEVSVLNGFFCEILNVSLTCQILTCSSSNNSVIFMLLKSKIRSGCLRLSP